MFHFCGEELALVLSAVPLVGSYAVGVYYRVWKRNQKEKVMFKATVEKSSEELNV